MLSMFYKKRTINVSRNERQFVEIKRIDLTIKTSMHLNNPLASQITNFFNKETLERYNLVFLAIYINIKSFS